ncbi:hypothetical protein VNO78_26651 [Psophocarpus tetragonolobus]|uniref:Uncharacterized protein n=1 Tax=Psophocarpus tetragonolobus TaxID=3891 RepID=A0AAN9X8S7_PSOTE
MTQTQQVSPNTSVVPLREVGSERNISRPSSRAATSRNPSSGDILQQGAITSAAMSPNTNDAQGQEVQAHLSAERNSPEDAAGESHVGESSNMGEQAEQAKKPETESNDSTNNIVHPSPPNPVTPQIYQFAAETRHIVPICYLHPQNAGYVITPPNQHGNRIAYNYANGYQTLPNQAGFYFSGAPHYIPFNNYVNTLTQIVPSYPYIGTDTMAPLHGLGNNINGYVGTAGYVNVNDRVRSAQRIIYHPPNQAGPSISRPSNGSQRMNYSVAATSSRTQNYNQVQISASGMPPYICYGTSILMVPYIPSPEVISRLPAEATYFVETLNDGSTHLFQSFLVKFLMVSEPNSSVEELYYYVAQSSFSFSFDPSP